MKTKIIAILFNIFVITAYGQTIVGTFPSSAGKEIALLKYDGFTKKELANTTLDSQGAFTIKYPKTYTGAALLQIKDGSSMIVLLNNENIDITWTNTQDINTLAFKNSPENDSFANGMKLYSDAESRLAALKYLLPQYKDERTKQEWLTREIAFQENRFNDFVASLSKNSYAAYYLTLRKLIADMPATANRYIERMAIDEQRFKALDFNDKRLWNSGLYGDLLEGYYQLMESHGDLSIVTAHANMGTDAVIKSLKGNPARQQDVTEYIFKLAEKRSLFDVAKHVATSMLGQDTCQPDAKRTDLFEQYRKMAVGNTAPDINLGKDKKLSKEQAKYKLVAFGASTCPGCQEDYPALISQYQSLKQKHGLEIYYISLDTDKKAYEAFYRTAAFTTSWDGKGWDSQAAKDYHVSATPTMLLLDNSLKIVTKIKSAAHLQAWLDAND